MSKTSIAAIVAGLFLVALVGFNLTTTEEAEDTPVVTSIRDSEADASTETEEAAPEQTPQDETLATEEVEAPAAFGTYTDYSQAEFASAVERDDRIVLSFSADWCPTCQTLKRNLNNGVIPDGLSILELDYDTETELKQQYGVTFQHTLVEIDANGNQVKKWAGSRDIDAIIQEL